MSYRSAVRLSSVRKKFPMLFVVFFSFLSFISCAKSQDFNPSMDYNPGWENDPNQVTSFDQLPRHKNRLEMGNP
ncbi:MAG: hypothetical protein HYZ67_03790 [Chlamydiae bacterium]|nr:hypothetical protein [Chlamydiota bacterium]